jgi:hypothetical protein
MLLAMASAPASAAPQHIVVYRGWYGPGWGWGWGPAWYGPAWWGPGYYYNPNLGRVKIVTHSKDAQVYVDGGYAGPVKKMKKFPLRPGTHELALREPNGETFYQQKIEVLRGKTTEIHADYRG